MWKTHSIDTEGHRHLGLAQGEIHFPSLHSEVALEGPSMRLKGRMCLCGVPPPGPPGKIYRTQREGWVAQARGRPSRSQQPQANAPLPTTTFTAEAPEVSALIHQAAQPKRIKGSNDDIPRWARDSDLNYPLLLMPALLLCRLSLAPED